MNQNRNRLVLLLIFFLFATPVVTATLMHTSWWPYQPDETVNRGLLVEPTQPLDYSALAFGDGIAPPLVEATFTDHGLGAPPIPLPGAVFEQIVETQGTDPDIPRAQHVEVGIDPGMLDLTAPLVTAVATAGDGGPVPPTPSSSSSIPGTTSRRRDSSWRRGSVRPASRSASTPTG